jgi:hypothetical protein
MRWREAGALGQGEQPLQGAEWICTRAHQAQQLDCSRLQVNSVEPP